MGHANELEVIKKQQIFYSISLLRIYNPNFKIKKLRFIHSKANLFDHYI